jgi:predicted nucleic acid-binding protein
MTGMTATRAFVDTNVLVYAFDDADPSKRDVARALLERRDKPILVLSTQVLIEFYVTVTRKLRQRVEPSAAAKTVAELAERPVVTTDTSLVQAAIAFSREHQLSLWDALILEAAATAACQVLLTEDLDAGSILRGVRIENPFAGN